MIWYGHVGFIYFPEPGAFIESMGFSCHRRGVEDYVTESPGLREMQQFRVKRYPQLAGTEI